MSSRTNIPQGTLILGRPSASNHNKKQIHNLHTISAAERGAMPHIPGSPISRGGPITNCLSDLRDLRLDSQELQGILRDVVARTGAARTNLNTALNDWRTYIETYEQTVAGASKAASQLRAVIKTYLVLQEKKHEATGDDMIVELSSLLKMLESYRFDFRASCQKLRDEISKSYGNITPDMLESTGTQPNGAIGRSIKGSAQVMLPGATFVSEEPMSALSDATGGDTRLKAAMLQVFQYAAVMRVRKTRNGNGPATSTAKPATRRRKDSPKARAMSDPTGLRMNVKTAVKRRISFGPCGKIEHFDEETETAPTSQQAPPTSSTVARVDTKGTQSAPTSHPTPPSASTVARVNTKGIKSQLSVRKRRTTGSVNLASIESTDQRTHPLEEEAFRELSQAITCVLNELDRLAPKFDAFSELAHHLRNEITAYINAFAGYKEMQTAGKRNALENMHARVEATSMQWKECLIALGEGLHRSSR
ncbi:hypothetical protein ACG7TL_008891 [Trametes sanguinea]